MGANLEHPNPKDFFFFFWLGGVFGSLSIFMGIFGTYTAYLISCIVSKILMK